MFWLLMRIFGYGKQQRKQKSKNISKFILSGGSLTFSEWLTLTEKEQAEAENAFADRQNLQMTALTYMLFPYDDEYRMILSKNLRKYDQGELEDLSKIIEFKKGETVQWTSGNA